MENRFFVIEDLSRKSIFSKANNYPLCNTNYTRVVSITKDDKKVSCKKCLKILKKVK